MARLKFTHRPSPVLAEHRPLYKIAQALLMIDICGWGRKCSIIKLHLLNWSLQSPSRLELLKNAADNKKIVIPVWGFDPALAIALQLATEEKLLVIDGGGLKITEKGSIFLEEVVKDKDVLNSEKEALGQIGKGLTEPMVSAAAKGWE